MSDHHQLPVLLVPAQLFHHKVGYQGIVQIVFRLVEQQWLVAMNKQEGQHCGGFLTGGCQVNVLIGGALSRPIF
ncbi:hypothetical protein D3C85_1424460 [compost metagenome]